MNPDAVDPILLQTLTDFRISASEKQSLKQWSQTHLSSENDRAYVRHRAFEIARQQVGDNRSREVVSWLEEVIKLLNRSDATATVEAQTYFAPGEDCLQAILQQFNRVRTECDICVFTITDDRITHAILNAHHRGVQIRLITDDEKSLDPGSDIARLKGAAIPLRMDRVAGHMHHKFAIFDQKYLLTGSFNWTRSASENNEENLLLTSEGRLVSGFAKEFEALWKRLGG